MNRAARRRQLQGTGTRAASPGHPALERLFDAAHAAALAGSLEEAERLYRDCLALDPRHADARHDLGVLALRRGQYRVAIDHLDGVVAQAPTHAGAWLNLSLAHGQNGDAAAARSAAERAIALKPDLAPAQAALGNALSLTPDLEGAASAFRAALALDPDAVPVKLAFATLLRRMGDFQTGLACCDAFVAAHPDDPKGYVERSLFWSSLDRSSEAEADLRTATAIEGPDGLSARALCSFLARTERLEEAIEIAGRAVAASPNSAALRNDRAELLQRRGRLAEALADLQKAAELTPTDFQVFYNIGVTLAQGHHFAEASAAYMQAIELNPDFVQGYANLAVARLSMWDLKGALGLLAHVMALLPDQPRYAVDYCWGRLNACDWPGLEAVFRDCLQRCIATELPFPPFTIFAFGLPQDEFQLWTRAWAEKHVGVGRPALTRYTDAVAPLPRRIKVGYLSADFKYHATATLVSELLEGHDRAQFELVGYNIGVIDNSIMGLRMIAALDSFVDLNAFDDREAAVRIAEDGLDILVDLKGFTSDARSGILGYRPAPIQVNYLGYPGSMGTPLIDYMIADATVAPFAHQPFYDEALVHLPHCYQPNDRNRPGADPEARRTDHGLPEEGVVFCCFNTSYKITPLVFDIWMRLLRDVPGSVLWLIELSTYGTENLRLEAGKRGIAGDRLVFAPRLEVVEHIARLGLADLFLDTLPVNAHTTASETLWAGVPVLTCLGDNFVGRVAGSLLRAIGLPELVANDLAEYEATALRLARDPLELGALRERLVRNRFTTPLFDTPAYVRAYQAALARMVAMRIEGVAPAPFAITDADLAPA